MRAIILALAAWPAGMAAADVQKIVAELPANEDFEAPEVLQDMTEGVVWLDLTIAPSLDPSIEAPDGTYQDQACNRFEPIEARSVSVRTGSSHLLLNVRPGLPEQYGANLVSCEYAPQYSSDFEPGHVTRVKGCYYAHATSIPTAVNWILNPLPASACGIGD